MKDPPRCEDVADKLVRLFGWRQTYPVQKLQRNIVPKADDTEIEEVSYRKHYKPSSSIVVAFTVPIVMETLENTSLS
ncbi:unnamed protein product, partial [Brenthis ino]